MIERCFQTCPLFRPGFIYRALISWSQNAGQIASHGIAAFSAHEIDGQYKSSSLHSHALPEMNQTFPRQQHFGGLTTINWLPGLVDEKSISGFQSALAPAFWSQQQEYRALIEITAEQLAVGGDVLRAAVYSANAQTEGFVRFKRFCPGFLLVSPQAEIWGLAVDQFSQGLRESVTAMRMFLWIAASVSFLSFRTLFEVSSSWSTRSATCFSRDSFRALCKSSWKTWPSFEWSIPRCLPCSSWKIRLHPGDKRFSCHSNMNQLMNYRYVQMFCCLGQIFIIGFVFLNQ